MKKVFFVLFTVLFSMCAGACLPGFVSELGMKAMIALEEGEEETPNKMRDIALEYLNETYEDTFKAKSYSSGGLMYSYATVIFESEKYADSTVEVRIYENEDGTYTFVEDYYHCYMHEGALEYYKGLLGEEIPATVKVRFPAYVWSDELNGASTFAEWVQNGNCDMDVFYITNQEIPDEKKNALVEQVAQDKVMGLVTFFSTADEKMLSDKTLSEVLNNTGTLTDSEVKFWIDSDFEIEK